MSLNKKRKLICLDSDGTIMDTMTTKHKFCFAQAFIEVYGVNDRLDSEKIIEHWAKENLFTKRRGMNRFLGLEDIIIFSRTLGYEFDENNAISNWIKTSKSFSMNALEEMIKNYPNESAYTLAYNWSKKANEKIKTMPCVAFKNMKQYIENLYEKCDIMGVSSAPLSAVTEEWTQEGIISYFKDIACQERGSKTNVLNSLIKEGYNPNDILMIGDAVSDYDAAKDNKIKFYPIIPGKEEKAWEDFFNGPFNEFLQDKYNEEYQDKLLIEFFDVLR